MIGHHRRRLARVEDRLARRVRFQRDAVTDEWLKGMSIDDLDFMATLAKRREAGELEAEILASLPDAERARVDRIYAERDRIHAVHNRPA